MVSLRLRFDASSVSETFFIVSEKIVPAARSMTITSAIMANSIFLLSDRFFNT